MTDLGFLIAGTTIISYFAFKVADWIEAAILYALGGVAAMFTGWYWYEATGNVSGLAMGLIFVVFGLALWTFAIKACFARGG